MWSTQTLWFDVAIVTSIFAVGNVVFGHFEEHKPKYKRVMKIAAVTAIVVALSASGLRWAAYAAIGAMFLAAGYIHICWLPSHGVNGLTGEPREIYYKLIGVQPKPSRE